MLQVTLNNAIRLFARETGAGHNSYEWYRKSAQQQGTIEIGGTIIPAHKERGVWCVENTKLAKAIRNQRQQTERIKQITRDYRKRIFHGKSGETVRTTWGGYQIRGKFRFAWTDLERAKKESYGNWYCNSCNKPAGTKHDKPECHLCSDWNGCGKDCTLSEVYCLKCDHSLKV